MVLAIDVGNSNITAGIFDGDLLCGTFRITTKVSRTSDEYGTLLINMIQQQQISDREITDAIVSSVVPDVMHSFSSALIKYFGIRPMVVSAGIKTGMQILLENPKQLGADRITDAVAAYTLYGGPVIVTDYGTATTYDVVGPNATFEGGVTAPGILTSARAMWDEAAMLPAIEIKVPDTILAKETVASMQAGIAFGQIGQLEYIVDRLRKESGYTDAKVVVTGGLGRTIAAETDYVDVYDAELTLKGLRILYDKNRKH